MVGFEKLKEWKDKVLVPVIGNYFGFYKVIAVLQREKDDLVFTLGQLQTQVAEVLASDSSNKIKILELQKVIDIENKEKEFELMITNKIPKAERYYSRHETDGEYSVDVRNFFMINDNRVPIVKGATNDDKALLALNWVKSNITYVPDSSSATYKKDEYWAYAYQTLKHKMGDCIAEYEEIYTKEGIKTAKEIKEGDLVLSYDFNANTFVYNPIVKKWNKGLLNIKRVHFRNGQHIDVTDNHHMAIRVGENYLKKDLKDVDLTKYNTRKVPIAKKIPYEIKDIGWLNEDLCFVLGHFLAEGWIEKSHVCSSGYDLIEDIIPLLEKNNVLFSEYSNNSGVPVINFLKSDFKEFLKLQKNSSFDIHLQEELFHLPENKLIKILEGFWLGDGHNGNYVDKRGYASNKQEVYSTSSIQWANDIQRIGLQIGKSFHIWKQENHKGVGKKPIYRITFNPNSYFLKDYGFKDISEVSISYIEDLGKFQTYDWEVKDTHTFVFKNGVITYQCEDGAILIANIMVKSGIPWYRVRVCAGSVKGGGHAYCVYCRETDNEWVVMDWCYFYKSTLVKDRLTHKQERNYFNTEMNYYVWFSWDLFNVYAKEELTTVMMGKFTEKGKR